MAFLPTNTCDLQSGILEDKAGPEGRGIVGNWTPHVLKAVAESCFILKHVLGPCYANLQPGEEKKAALLRALKDFLKCFLLIGAGVSAKFLKLVEFTRIQRESIYTSLLARKVSNHL